jgi:hypothetical protein
MSGGVALEEAEIALEANGQTSWYIDDAFPATDTSDFSGSVRCAATGAGRFTAIAAERTHDFDPRPRGAGERIGAGDLRWSHRRRPAL